MNAPRLVETQVTLPNPALFGSRGELDAFADRMIALEQAGASWPVIPDERGMTLPTASQKDIADELGRLTKRKAGTPHEF